MDNLINHPGIIAAFSLVVVIMLLLDLGIFNKRSHAISNKEAAIWTLVLSLIHISEPTRPY